MCVCGRDKSVFLLLISITTELNKVPGSLQTSVKKQILPKQHERNVVKVALYSLKVRKYQKLGYQ